MTATHAIVAREPTEPLRVNWSLEEVDVHVPGDDEILVEMRATGICHTDILLSSLPSGTLGLAYPKVVGHEGAGIVRAIGQNVRSAHVGDPVLLSYYSCTECGQCRDSHPAYCDAFQSGNYLGRQRSMSTKGKGEEVWTRFFGQSSFAHHSIVSETSVVNVKDFIYDTDELKLFAPLGCGFQTGMGAIQNISSAGADDAVLIFGLGAVGMGALMTAKIQKCSTIIVVDRIEHRLQTAKSLGATHTINTKSLETTALNEAVLAVVPGGVSIVIETTGVPALLEYSLKSLKNRGKLILIGVPPLGYELKVNVTEHINAIPQMIQWYREGRFPIDRLVQYFKATEFGNALSHLEEGVTIKPVLTEPCICQETEGAESDGNRRKFLINELDGSGAGLEAPATKSEMTAELPTDVKTAELQADNAQDIAKDRKTQNPPELE
ncbi:unnamed protein product [Penicillium pancosmium]